MENELPAHEAFQAGAPEQRGELLVEGSIQRRDASSEAPEHTRHLAEDLHVLGVERRKSGVLRLEADAAVALAMERLDRGLVGRLVVADQRDDDLAGARVRPACVRRRCRRRGSRPRSSSRLSPAAENPRRGPAARGRRSALQPPRLRGAARRRRSARRAGASARTPHAAGASSRRRPTSSRARGFVGSRFSRPARSRFARCACTVEGEARPTASPISRTVGG